MSNAMRKQEKVDVPTATLFRKAIKEFRRRESRDAMYKVARFIISYYWECHTQMAQIADGLGVLLLTWNQACYRYGPFSFLELEKCLRNNWGRINEFNKRDITDLTECDKNDVAALFNSFLEALKIEKNGKAKGRKSPVAVAKALHVLVPEFFPLWDYKIAVGHRCCYSKPKDPAEKYCDFSIKMRNMAEAVLGYDGLPKDVTLLKLIDEYNYARYTKRWV